jgi:hypothetical protein
MMRPDSQVSTSSPLVGSKLLALPCEAIFKKVEGLKQLFKPVCSSSAVYEITTTLDAERAPLFRRVIWLVKSLRALTSTDMPSFGAKVWLLDEHQRHSSAQHSFRIIVLQNNFQRRLFHASCSRLSFG